MLIVDYDAHHGNGTQEIFYADPRVLYVSFHEWPLYPGTGRHDEIGHGAGEGTTLNLPLPAGATGDVYLRALDDVVAPRVEGFAPTWVLISAGFDAHRADPLTGLGLSAGDYAAISERDRGLRRTRPPDLVPRGRLRPRCAARLGGHEPAGADRGGFEPDRRRIRDARVVPEPRSSRRSPTSGAGARPVRASFRPGNPAPQVFRAPADDVFRSPARRSIPRLRPVSGRTTLLDLDNLLRESVRREASDVHIKVGSPPYLRVDGHLQPWDSRRGARRPTPSGSRSR